MSATGDLYRQAAKTAELIAALEMAERSALELRSMGEMGGGIVIFIGGLAEMIRLLRMAERDMRANIALMEDSSAGDTPPLLN